MRGDLTGLRGRELIDVTWQPLYDRQLLTPGCTRVDFFVEPVGCGRPPKTYAETNLLFPDGDLPRQERFVCVGLELMARAPNLDELLDVGVLEFSVRLRNYLILAPLRAFYFGRRDLARLSWWRRWLYRLVVWIERLLGVRRPTMFEIVPLQIDGPGAGIRLRLSFSEPLKLSAPIRVTMLLHGYRLQEAS